MSFLFLLKRTKIIEFIKIKIINWLECLTRIICLITEEGITKTFTCARALVGQYVFLQLVGVEGSLSLCEVEVFATDGENHLHYKKLFLNYYIVKHFVCFFVTEFSVDRCVQAGTSAEADLVTFNSTCYEFVIKKGGSFKEARTHCQSRGGDLVHGFKVGLHVQTNYANSYIMLISI